MSFATFSSVLRRMKGGRDTQEKILKNFFITSIISAKLVLLGMKGRIGDFLLQLLCRGEVIPFGTDQTGKGYCFSDLTAEQQNQLSAYDDLLEINYFQVMDKDVPVRDEDISDALKKLPERKRMIILMAFFLDMTEQEIADYYHLVQSTVHYHKAESLRILKGILE